MSQKQIQIVQLGCEIKIMTVKQTVTLKVKLVTTAGLQSVQMVLKSKSMTKASLYLTLKDQFLINTWNSNSKRTLLTGIKPVSIQ